MAYVNPENQLMPIDRLEARIKALDSRVVQLEYLAAPSPIVAIRARQEVVNGVYMSWSIEFLRAGSPDQWIPIEPYYVHTKGIKRLTFWQRLRALWRGEF